MFSSADCFVTICRSFVSLFKHVTVICATCSSANCFVTICGSTFSDVPFYMVTLYCFCLWSWSANCFETISRLFIMIKWAWESHLTHITLQCFQPLMVLLQLEDRPLSMLDLWGWVHCYQWPFIMIIWAMSNITHHLASCSPLIALSLSADHSSCSHWTYLISTIIVHPRINLWTLAVSHRHYFIRTSHYCIPRTVILPFSLFSLTVLLFLLRFFWQSSVITIDTDICLTSTSERSHSINLTLDGLKALDLGIRRWYATWLLDAPESYKSDKFFVDRLPIAVTSIYGQNQPLAVWDDDANEDTHNWSRSRDFTKLRYVSVSIASHFEYVLLHLLL